MDYQLRAREREVLVGIDEQQVADFQKAGFLIYNLAANYDGMDYQMKLPAPWTGFRYRLRQNDRELASAKRLKVGMHSALFELEIEGRVLQLKNEDDVGTSFAILEGEEKLGGSVLRQFGRDAQWFSDVQLPDGWSVPLAAFVEWVLRDARGALNGSA